MSVSCDPGYISSHIDWIIKIVTMTVGGDIVSQTLRPPTMQSPLEQCLVTRDVGRNVGHIKEDMESCEVSNEITCATVTVVEDGINGVLQVGAGRVHGH